MVDIASIGLRISSQGLRDGINRLRRLEREGSRAERTMRTLAKGSAVMATSVAAATTAAAAYTVAVANQVKETQNLAESIGITVTELQAWESAASTVGVSTEALGDIFKDTQDKLGDFIRTGGGEAADMFEQLNLNAEELLNLSPDQQLLKIGDAVSKLGTRGEQIFFMEALANDASRLLPLLENGGEELRALREEALRTGVALSGVDNAALVELSESISESQRQLKGLGRMFAAELAPAISVALDTVGDFFGEFDRQDVARFVEIALTGFGSLANAVHNLRIIAGELGAGFTELGVYVADVMADSADVTAKFANLALLPITTILARIIQQYGEFAGTMASLAEAAPGMDTLAAGLRDVEQRALAASDNFANLRVSADGVRLMANSLNESLEAQRDELDRLRAMEPPSERMRKAIQAYREELEKSIEEEEARRGAINQTNTETDSAATTTKALTTATDEYANSLQPLLDRLYPVEAASRQYRNEQEALTVALARGEIGVVRYLDALNRLEEAQRSEQTPSEAYSGVGFGSQISSGEQGPGMGEQDPFAQWLEQANQAFTSFDQLQADTAQSFQTSFGQAFEQVLMGTKSADEAFKEMGRTILSTVVTAIGEMIAQWLVAQAVQIAMGQTGAAAALTTAAATGPAMAAAYAPAAAMASLASFGTNSVPAIAGITATTAAASTAATLGNFAGMFDEGGRIGGGQWGIAGEYGPEIIKGPAQITSRKDTAAMMSGGDVTVNVNNAPPGTQVKERSVNGNQVIDVLVADLSQNGRASQAMQSTFGMNRRGR